MTEVKAHKNRRVYRQTRRTMTKKRQRDRDTKTMTMDHDDQGDDMEIDIKTENTEEYVDSPVMPIRVVKRVKAESKLIQLPEIPSIHYPTPAPVPVTTSAPDIMPPLVLPEPVIPFTDTASMVSMTTTAIPEEKKEDKKEEKKEESSSRSYCILM